MSSQVRVNVDNQSERQNLMTGRIADPADRKKRPIRKITRQELAVVPHQRNWKGLFLSVLVIAIVCTLIGLSAWLLQPPEEGRDYKYKYDFDAMFDMAWRPFSSRGKWIGEYFVYQDSYMNVMRWKDGISVMLIDNETMGALGIYDFRVSPDLKYVLTAYDVEKVFRHSTIAKYYIYTISTGVHTILHADMLQYAGWGPYKNEITFVLDSDLYYKSDVDAPPTRITQSGKGSRGNILNGISDWVYEEEMFLATEAHWISTAGSYLAYVSFNDTLVPEVEIVLYNTPYPEVEKIKYPKAGYDNPTVKLYIQNLKTNEKMEVTVPDMLKKKQPLLNSVVWASDNTLLATWSNRYQNTSATLVCSMPPSGAFADLSCRKIHVQSADGWIEHISGAPVIGPKGVYFQLQEKPYGARGNFHHLLMVNYTSEPAKTRFLTDGMWEVTKVVGYNEEQNRVYFISNKGSPGDRYFYYVDITQSYSEPFCLTCDGTCQYATAKMSADAKHAYVECSGPDVPSYSVVDLEAKEQTVLQDNIELREKVDNTKMPEIVYETVRIAGENGIYDLKAKLYLPPNRKEKKKVPLVVCMYAGPGSQDVNSRFYLDWKTYLATNQHMAVMVFDGRGSGFKGSHILKEINRRIGVHEVEDQITAIKQILQKHSYLDENNVAVWGWSYGGYVAAMVASHPRSISSNLTKCAISVAPVTDWTLYDSIYTERYMGSPYDNRNRYVESSLMTRASSFKSFKFLLIHGTRDDNVHFQNSAVLESALVRADVVHRYQVYTDETHSLSSEPKSTQRHLYHLMTTFLKDCFK